MKREFLGEVLQTIYLDISVYENSEMYIHQTNSEEMQRKTYIAKEHTLEDIFHGLEKAIHPRYTKVIIDCNPETTKFIIKWIDDKYNKHISKVDEIIVAENGLTQRICIEEQMLEMVQVVKYYPKRIDIKEFMAKRITCILKALE